jgi:predicted transcriptional regulator
MKVTVSIDSHETIEMNHADLSHFVSLLYDEKQYAAFFERLAEHPASDVRYAVADKSVLPIEVVTKLARDPSITVVRHVANNERAMETFDASLIKEMICRDVSVAEEIADNLSWVGQVARDEVIQMLMKHSDPKIVTTTKQVEADSWMFEKS